MKNEYRGVVRFRHAWQGYQVTTVHVVLPAEAALELEDGEEVTILRDEQPDEGGRHV